MRFVATRLFSALQDAGLYSSQHRAALAVLPPGTGRWLDVGCGPGLLARMAADAGYDALGIDRDAEMIQRARQLAAMRNNRANFAVGDAADWAAGGERFDVVSASSLLVVLPDPAAALGELLAMTKPNGAVLIIEAASAMTRRRAAESVLLGRLGCGRPMLLVWAMARSGRTLADAVFDQPGLAVTHYPILQGLVRASALRPAPTSGFAVQPVDAAAVSRDAQ